MGLSLVASLAGFGQAAPRRLPPGCFWGEVLLLSLLRRAIFHLKGRTAFGRRPVSGGFT